MTNWYLFRFAASAEARIKRGCKRYGVEMLYPKVVEWKRTKRDRKARPCEEPAFKGYLILGYDGLLPIRDIMGLHRSVRPVLVDGCLARVAQADVDAVRSNRLFSKFREGRMRRNLEPDPRFSEGEIVRILGGSMSGLGGRVLRIDRQARELRIEMDGPISAVTVSFDHVEKVA